MATIRWPFSDGVKEIGVGSEVIGLHAVLGFAAVVLYVHLLGTESNYVDFDQIHVTWYSHPGANPISYHQHWATWMLGFCVTKEEVEIPGCWTTDVPEQHIHNPQVFIHFVYV